MTPHSKDPPWINPLECTELPPPPPPLQKHWKQETTTCTYPPVKIPWSCSNSSNDTHQRHSSHNLLPTPPLIETGIAGSTLRRPQIIKTMLISSIIVGSSRNLGDYRIIMFILFWYYYIIVILLRLYYHSVTILWLFYYCSIVLLLSFYYDSIPILVLFHYYYVINILVVSPYYCSITILLLSCREFEESWSISSLSSSHVNSWCNLPVSIWLEPPCLRALARGAPAPPSASRVGKNHENPRTEFALEVTSWRSA